MENDVDDGITWEDALAQDVRGQDSDNSVLIAYDDNDILYAISSAMRICPPTSTMCSPRASLPGPLPPLILIPSITSPW